MGLNFDHPHIETGDKEGALSDWRFTGASDQNTDRGRLYVRLDSGNVELFNDPGFAAANLVAQGADTGADTTITLTEQNNSGLGATVFRSSGNITDGTSSFPELTVYVWLCSERDLRENEDHLGGLLLDGETDFSIPLTRMMRRFITEMSSVYPPPPLVGHPLRWAPPFVEAGQRGEPEFDAGFFWCLNRRGQWEITGLQNPDDFREWAIFYTLALVYFRKARAHDPEDPWWTKYLVAKEHAAELFRLVKPWVDCNRDNKPERAPRVRSVRFRRG